MTLVLRPNPFQVKMFTHRVQECSVVLDADCSLSRGALYATTTGTLCRTVVDRVTVETKETNKNRTQSNANKI